MFTGLLFFRIMIIVVFLQALEWTFRLHRSGRFLEWMTLSVSTKSVLHAVFMHNMNIYRCVDRFQCIELLLVSSTLWEQKMRHSTVQQSTWSWVPEKLLVLLLRNILSIPNSRTYWPPIDFILSKINSVQIITISCLNICLWYLFDHASLIQKI